MITVFEEVGEVLSPFMISKMGSGFPASYDSACVISGIYRLSFLCFC